MKPFIFLLTILFGSLTFATVNPEALRTAWSQQKTCGNFVRFDDQAMYTGFGWYRQDFSGPRQPTPANFLMIPLNGNQATTFPTLDSAIDVVTASAMAYVLTYSDLEIWDLEAQARVAVVPTTHVGGPLADQQHAQGLARYQDILIVAHGRLGVSFINMRTHEITNEYTLIPSQLPLESMATGVTVQGHYAYVVMDNYTLTDPHKKAAFRGIVVIDMETQKVVAELGGMDPGADAIFSDSQHVFVSFDGPVYEYAIAKLAGSALPKPDRRVWQFPTAGHPYGRPTLDGTNFYSCNLLIGGGTNGSGLYTPMAVSLSSIPLD